MRLQGEGNNWVVAVADVRDLTKFAAKRRSLHLAPEFVDVASLGDAGLRFLAEFSTQEPRKDLKTGCRVIAMGYVKYYANQSVRKSILDVPPKTGSVRRYRRLHSVFPNHFQRRKVEPLPEPAKERRRMKKPGLSADAPEGNGWYKFRTTGRKAAIWPFSLSPATGGELSAKARKLTLNPPTSKPRELNRWPCTYSGPCLPRRLSHTTTVARARGLYLPSRR